MDKSDKKFLCVFVGFQVFALTATVFVDLSDGWQPSSIFIHSLIIVVIGGLYGTGYYFLSSRWLDRWFKKLKFPFVIRLVGPFVINVVLYLSYALSMFFVVGHLDIDEICGNNPAITVTYTTGRGLEPGSGYGEKGISISETSFKNGKLTFTYTNNHSRTADQVIFDGELCYISVKIYNTDNTLVDEISKRIYPGQVSLPCNGKVFSIPTNAKGQTIGRVDVEHICEFSADRYGESLRKSLGY